MRRRTITRLPPLRCCLLPIVATAWLSGEGSGSIFENIGLWSDEAAPAASRVSARVWTRQDYEKWGLYWPMAAELLYTAVNPWRRLALSLGRAWGTLICKKHSNQRILASTCVNNGGLKTYLTRQRLNEFARPIGLEPSFAALESRWSKIDFVSCLGSQFKWNCRG